MRAIIKYKLIFLLFGLAMFFSACKTTTTAESVAPSHFYTIENGFLFENGKPVSTSITSLNLTGCYLEDYSFLRNFSNLKTLILDESDFDDPSLVAHMSRLTTLNMSGCAVRSLSSLSELSKLEVLSFGCEKLKDIEPLSILSNIQELGLTGLTEDMDLSSLADLDNLRSLFLSGSPNTSSLSQLSSLEALTVIAGSAVDLNFIAQLPRLQNLRIANHSSEPLKLPELNQQNLWRLILTGDFAEYDPISGLTAMKDLTIWANTTFDSPELLTNMLELETLNLATISQTTADTLQKLLPECDIHADVE